MCCSRVRAEPVIVNDLEPDELGAALAALHKEG